MARKNGKSPYTHGRGRFAKGNPGRPRGARHKTSQAIEALLEGEAEGLTCKAVDMALQAKPRPCASVWSGSAHRGRTRQCSSTCRP